MARVPVTGKVTNRVVAGHTVIIAVRCRAGALRRPRSMGALYCGGQACLLAGKPAILRAIRCRAPVLAAVRGCAAGCHVWRCAKRRDPSSSCYVVCWTRTTSLDRPTSCYGQLLCCASCRSSRAALDQYRPEVPYDSLACVIVASR